MGNDHPPGAWQVDFDTRQASQGDVVVAFRLCGEEGFGITFLSGGGGTIEEQCALAGQAITAIRAAMLSRPG